MFYIIIIAAGAFQPLLLLKGEKRMTTQTILEQAGIPLLLFVICMYYGLKLMILQDVSTIRGKNKEPVKDEKAYAKKGGALILFFGFATLVMTFLLFVNLYVALAQIVICTIIFGVLWKKMNDKYGA